MKILVLSILATMVGLGTAYSADFYGKNPDLPAKYAISLDQAVRDFKKADQAILVKGEVKKVCEKKGCWLTMNSKSNKVRVTFEGYSFFVPKNLVGRSVLVQGKLEQKVVTVAEQKHYLKDEGASESEIAKVKSDKTTWHLVASGVKAI